MAVLAHGGLGVAVDVEGVRDLRSAPVPDSQPDRGLCPGRRPGGGLGHADLETDRRRGSSHFFPLCEHVRFQQVSLSPFAYLFQAASCLIGQGVCAGSSGRKQGEAGANLASRSTAVIGQLESTAFMKVQSTT